jgi:hypothetical protein
VFPEVSSFSAFLWGLLFGWWWFLIFFFDFFDAPVQVGFESVAHVVSSEGVCPGGYGKFSREGSCDFSSLPSFGIVKQGGLED